MFELSPLKKISFHHVFFMLFFIWGEMWRTFKEKVYACQDLHINKNSTTIGEYHAAIRDSTANTAAE